MPVDDVGGKDQRDLQARSIHHGGLHDPGHARAIAVEDACQLAQTTFLDLLLEIVFAEGALSPEKLAIVRRLCATLGVHEQELAALAAMRGYGFGHAGGGYRQSQSPPGAPPGKDPYAVLGLSREASDREIKTAYRRLIGQHHPDKLGDVPEELKRRAEERAREINIAYEKIREERNIK